MNLKQIKIISLFGIFLLCFLTHSAYQFMPNIITSVLFPVNESIFEHMKMIIISIVIWSLIEQIIIKKNNLIVNNNIFNIFISSITNIIIFLIIYLPIYYSIKESFPRTIILLFISIGITQLISYKILTTKQILNNKWSLILIIILYISTTLLTYNPPNCDFFYDTLNNNYGIKK